LHCHPKRYGGWAKAGVPGYSEKEELVTNCDRLRNLQHSSVNPMAFTEQGEAMLSTVLRSEKAIRINIQIMRAFARYRGLLRENEELRKEMAALDNKHNASLQFLLERIDELHPGRNEPRRSIGYKYKERTD
jgi:hypothetical protein